MPLDSHGGDNDYGDADNLKLSPAYPGGAKGARAPRGSKATTVKLACFGLTFM